MFGPEDSGTASAPITYAAAPGERPVLSGGRPITGWRKFDDKLWTADLPDVKAGHWRFNQLYVGGEPRTRARIPNEGFLRVAACPEGTPKTANYHKACQTFQFKPGDIRADWTNLQDVEVIVYHFWTDSHLPIKSVDTTSNLVTFACKATKTFTDDFTENGARYIVENVFEGLDAPGEWYLNRHTGVLFYYPKAGEDMSRVEVIAPQLPALHSHPGQRGATAPGGAHLFPRVELPVLPLRAAPGQLQRPARVVQCHRGGDADGRAPVPLRAVRVQESRHLGHRSWAGLRRKQLHRQRSGQRGRGRVPFQWRHRARPSAGAQRQ